MKPMIFTDSHSESLLLWFSTDCVERSVVAYNDMAPRRDMFPLRLWDCTDRAIEMARQLAATPGFPHHDFAMPGRLALEYELTEFETFAERHSTTGGSFAVEIAATCRCLIAPTMSFDAVDRAYECVGGAEWAITELHQYRGFSIADAAINWQQRRWVELKEIWAICGERSAELLLSGKCPIEPRKAA